MPSRIHSLFAPLVFLLASAPPLLAGCDLISGLNDIEANPFGGSSGNGSSLCGGIRCDDQNPCTVDRCEQSTQTCSNVVATDGTDCDSDNDACNGVSLCQSGQCVAGQGPQLDDDNACTKDSCDPLSGVVSHDPIQGCSPNEKGWRLLPSEQAPSKRSNHSAVWTGEKMIVWGGRSKSGVSNDGASYDPVNDTWTPISQQNAPSARHSHSAVWTGSRMLVWGGFGSNDYLTDGAAYDPASDSWQAIANAPIGGRTRHSTTWTGEALIVWGGIRGVNALGNGASYNPATNSWQTIASNGAPSNRHSHTATWTGDKLLIWSGINTFDWFDDGRFYSPQTNSWLGASSDEGVPLFRERASSAFGNNRIIVWGGWDGGNYLGDGATLDATTLPGVWQPMASDKAPSPRANHVSLWLGSELFVWAGCTGQACSELLEDGGVWNAKDDSWNELPADSEFQGRIDHASVWTGSQVIVFGGNRGTTTLGNGARFRWPQPR